MFCAVYTGNTKSCSTYLCHPASARDFHESLLTDQNYEIKTKSCFQEIVDINRGFKPDTLWETIEGAIRNETIKYAALRKKNIAVRRTNYFR